MRLSIVFAGLVVVLVLASGIAVAGPSGAATESVSTTSDGLTSDTTGGNETVRGQVPVIITFENESARASAPFDGLNVTVTGGWDVDVTPVLFADMPRDSIDDLTARPGVQSVGIDRRVEVPPGPEPADPVSDEQRTDLQAPGQTVPWGVDRIDAPEAARQVPASEQDDVTVAVVDSGIDYQHSDLDDNVAWGADFTGGNRQNGVAAADDDNGHGTSVAGIIAAEDNTGGVLGVAPDVQLYAMKVSESDGNGRVSWMLSGIDAGIKGPDGQLGTDDDADVVSISLGAGSSYFQFRNSIEQASNHAVLVSSAGNGGDGDTSSNEITYPAKYSDVIAVAATNRNNDTTTFSAEGSEIEVAAPGYRVRTTNMGGGTTYFSGTSAAAPYVSGAIALLVADDLEDGTRDLSLSDLRKRVRDTATDIEASGVDKKAGHGLIRADEALPNGTSSGNVTGQIHTEYGTAIPGATVELLHSGSVVETKTSDSSGAYEFTDVEAGRDYTVRATVSGETGSAGLSNLKSGTTTRDVIVSGLNDQYEPDGTIGESTLLTAGDAVDTLRIFRTDVDVFEVPLSGGETLDVSISFDHDDANLRLRASNAAGNQTAVSDSNTDDESLSITAADTESYYIFVQSTANNTADYSLNTSVSGTRTTGFVSGRVTSTLTGSGIENANVTLTNTAGRTVETVTTGASGGYTAELPSGKYTLDVSATGYGTAQQSVQVTGNTTVTADVTLTPGNDQYEPNDDIQNAASIGTGTYSDLRIIDSDRDVFAIDLSKGEDLTASIDFTHSTSDLDLTLYGPNQRVREKNTSLTDGETITLTDASENGTYYLEVNSFDNESAPYSLSTTVVDRQVTGFVSARVTDAVTGSGIGNATVTITNTAGQVVKQATTDASGYDTVELPSGGYTLNVSATGYTSQQSSLQVVTNVTTTANVPLTPANDQYEPNDDIQSAATIDAGTHPGLWIIGSDRDVFAIDLSNGTDLTASIDVTNSTGTLDLTLHEPSKQVLKRGTSTSDGQSVSITDAGTNGTYYLAVESPTNTSAGYSLTVQTTGSSNSIQSTNRTVADASIGQGGSTTATVTATVTQPGDSVTLTETFSGAVGSATLQTVTVDGQTVSPDFSQVDGNGAVVALSNTGGQATAEITYEITAAQTTGNISVAGELDRGQATATLDTDSIAVTGGCLPGIVGNYDANGDCRITISELGTAASDYANGQISITELGDVASAYANT